MGAGYHLVGLFFSWSHLDLDIWTHHQTQGFQCPKKRNWPTDSRFEAEELAEAVKAKVTRCPLLIDGLLKMDTAMFTKNHSFDYSELPCLCLMELIIVLVYSVLWIGVSEFIGSIPTIFQYYRNNGYHELWQWWNIYSNYLTYLNIYI